MSPEQEEIRRLKRKLEEVTEENDQLSKRIKLKARAPNECEICFEQYRSRGRKVPRVVPCGHTVCHACATSLIEEATLMCPFDRKTFVCKSAADLTKNFLALQGSVDNQDADGEEEEEEDEIAAVQPPEPQENEQHLSQPEEEINIGEHPIAPAAAPNRVPVETHATHPAPFGDLQNVQFSAMGLPMPLTAQIVLHLQQAMGELGMPMYYRMMDINSLTQLAQQQPHFGYLQRFGNHQ